MASVTIRLRPDLAPKHVEQIKALAKRGFYDGVVFHRVIDGFMAQTGDPTGTGTGGSDLPDIPAEFTAKAKFVRGTVGMARSQDPNSANSQFFIMYGPAPSLDGQYTIVGRGRVRHGGRRQDQEGTGGEQRHGRRTRTRSCRCGLRAGRELTTATTSSTHISTRKERPHGRRPREHHRHGNHARDAW